MKSITDLIHAPQMQNNSIQEFEQKQSIQKATAEATNSLFKELCVIFPSFLATIKKSSPEDAKRLFNKTKKMWLDEILEEKITSQMIDLGLRKCRKSTTGFMPTVGEFINWCKPTDADLGIPSIDNAYREACQHRRGKTVEQYSHAIVYEAGRMTGFFDLTGKPETTMKPLFKEKYLHLREKLLRGEQIQIIENAIEDRSQEKHDIRTPAQKEADRVAAAEKAFNQLFGR